MSWTTRTNFQENTTHFQKASRDCTCIILSKEHKKCSHKTISIFRAAPPISRKTPPILFRDHTLGKHQKCPRKRGPYAPPASRQTKPISRKTRQIFRTTTNYGGGLHACFKQETQPMSMKTPPTFRTTLPTSKNTANFEAHTQKHTIPGKRRKLSVQKLPRQLPISRCTPVPYQRYARTVPTVPYKAYQPRPYRTNRALARTVPTVPADRAFFPSSHKKQKTNSRKHSQFLRKNAANFLVRHGGTVGTVRGVRLVRYGGTVGTEQGYGWWLVRCRGTVGPYLEIGGELCPWSASGQQAASQELKRKQSWLHGSAGQATAPQEQALQHGLKLSLPV